jgi:hypothetical protein
MHAWKEPRIIRDTVRTDSADGLRNAHTVWEISTHGYGGQHYATFPLELARRCILAGTSAYGVCSMCLAPHVRLVEKEHYHTQWGGPAQKDHQQGIRNAQGFIRHGLPECPSVKTTTIGWVPTCTHDAPVVPARVFDPFCGSGTTLVAARELGRHGVGLDLSWPYLSTIARERLGLTALDAWQGKPTPAVPITYDDLPLFGMDS